MPRERVFALDAVRTDGWFERIGDGIGSFQALCDIVGEAFFAFSMITGARITALQGANLLFYPTAIGWHPAEKAEFGEAQYDAWQTIQRGHAIANGVFVAAVNRVGMEHGDVKGNKVEGAGLEFWGGSFLADPFGRIIAKAAHDKEEILIGEIDLRLLEDTRRNWPFLRDRRIDAYAPIASRFLDAES